tara:strand:+ start:283 stop:903 length:621 start_codon:yes stop_codon:yes gene_type:complete
MGSRFPFFHKSNCYDSGYQSTNWERKMPVKIHGKEYKTVAERVTELHKDNKNKSLSIETELVSWSDGVVIFKSTVTTGSGVFTGYAYEKENASQINKTSALENCETSSIGRAIAAAGYSGTEYASANEVQNAIEQQKTTQNNTKVSIKPLDKKHKDMVQDLHTYKGHHALSNSQQVKVKELLNNTLSMDDKDTITKYHKNVMELVQ